MGVKGIMNYQKIARFYDDILGNRHTVANRIEYLIDLYKKDTKSILEIACGTGQVLDLLKEKYDITGIDISNEMLAEAKKKLPGASLLKQDMRTMELGKKYDVVVSVFDSIIHLLKLEDWEKTFKSVANHLKKGGLFILDVNTLDTLHAKAQHNSLFYTFDKSHLSVKVIEKEDGFFDWDIKIFEKLKDGKFALHEEYIPTRSFKTNTIKDSLLKSFNEVEVFDFVDDGDHREAKRVYFICTV